MRFVDSFAEFRILRRKAFDDRIRQAGSADRATVAAQFVEFGDE